MKVEDDWFEKLAAAKSDIMHQTDGPVNRFVAISRAVNLANSQKYSAYLIANALDSCLETIDGHDLESVEYG